MANPIELDMERIPQSVAIIMDGNGRWAAKRHLPRVAGHKAGSDTLQKIADAAMDLGIKHLTVYAFSTENWSRSNEEVGGIMRLLRWYLDDHIRRHKQERFKIDMIGEMVRLAPDIQERILRLEELTKDKPGMRLHIALNYGGRDELMRAVRKIAAEAVEGKLQPEALTEADFAGYLDTRGIPDPDLLIRTSGEERISNFLLWQIAYTEMVFTDTLWPDFSENDLKQAIAEYQSRQRRFGGR